MNAAIEDVAMDQAALNSCQLLESLGESLVVVDRDFRVVWFKDPLLARCKPGLNPVGKYCFSVLADRTSPCDSACPVKPVLATGRPCSMEKQFVDPDGLEAWREARAFPVLDGNGRVAFVARISFNITRRKQNQTRRWRRYKNMELVLKEMSDNQTEPKLLRSEKGLRLTPRELEVLGLLVRGLSKPQIAGMLGLSPHTIKRHVANIYNKLGLNDRTQLAVWATRQGLT